MLTYPDIDPVALAIGPLKVHWYGVMYLIAFVGGWWLARVRARDEWRGFSPREADDLLFYIACGVIAGGRLGYMIFYDFERLLSDPSAILRVWQGGMSFHGGLIGVLAAMALYGRKSGRTFFQVTDFIAPYVAPGLGLGRLGNFINGNLWGQPSDVPWAMVFPSPAAGSVPRHPTQLYEFALEGAALFAIVWLYSRRPRPVMAVSGLFLIGYAVFRFGVEFLRVPDAHIGYLASDWFTMGQLLTLPMFVFGVVLMWLAHGRRGSVSAPAQQASPRDGAHSSRPGNSR